MRSTPDTAVRRAALIRLRRQGVPFDDTRIVDDLGYPFPSAARKDLVHALKANLDDEAAEASIYRQQENERPDALLAAVWPQATEKRPIIGKDGEFNGEGVDIRAVDTVIRLIDRRAKLNGLDAPATVELSGPGGGSVRLGHVGLAELNKLIATAGDPDDADADEEDDDFGYVNEGEETDDEGDTA
ncbi:hypothetical protein ACGFYZ_40930 [Streptomyces sp. NPDC048330]|uniref:hypothetical protein n=1 Tax=Streptomyces sp. NPDC048330 TaxID=3365533 RepID=UPI003710AF08